MSKMFPVKALSIALVLYACGPSAQSDVQPIDVDEVVEVTTVPSPYAETTLYPGQCFLLSDTILAVYEPKIREGFMQFYDDRTHRLLASFGQSGEGPDDFINPRIVTDNQDLATGCFTVADSRRLCRVDVHALLTDPAYKGETYARIPSSLKLYNAVLHYSDSLMVVNQSGPYQLTFQHTGVDRATRMNFFRRNEDLDVLDLALTAQVYSATYASCADHIAIAYRNWKQIDIVSIGADSVCRISFDDELHNRDKLVLEPDGINVSLTDDALIFFTRLLATDRYLYATCWDAKKREVSRGIAQSRVYQLDWTGRTVRIYHFDKAIQSICLQGDRIKYAIGISHDDREVKIYSCQYGDERD